jgi:hypothetical protein
MAGQRLFRCRDLQAVKCLDTGVAIFGFASTGHLTESFCYFLIWEEKKMSLCTVDELAPDTIKSYRSKLRRLWNGLPALPPDKARIAAQKIARLERQLGIKASDVRGPGRPRQFS